MIRNVIFDWSGTLVDDLPAVWAATNHVFREMGRPELTLDQFRAEFCLPFTSFYQRHVPGLEWSRLEELFHTHFERSQDQVDPLPHAREFLDFCRERGLRSFVLSTVRNDHYHRQAARAGLADYMERAYLGIWDKRAKIHELLKENGLNPRETLYVGDMQHDIDTAHHGGVFSCAVLTGYNTLGQLRDHKPHLIVEHLGELRRVLESSGLDFPPASLASGEVHPIPTVGALIFDPEGRVLMIQTQKWSHLWGIPGGKIKYNESATDALRRELMEETSLHVEDIRLVLVQDCIQSREFYREAHFVLLNYTCRCGANPKVRLNEEAVRFQWVTPAEAIKLPLNTPTRILLEAVSGNEPSLAARKAS